jgi:hypothetical protein
MHKFLIKTFVTLLAAGGLFTWFRADASVLAGAAALGMDDSSAWLAANSQDPKPFDLLEAVDAGMLRVDLPWNEVNSAPGAFAWAYKSEKGYKDFAQLFTRLDKRGIKPVLVLSGSPSFLNNLYPQQPVLREEFLAGWENYVRAAVQQFGDQVDFWQIGSEINDPAAWGKVIFPSADSPVASPDPVLYADMLKIAYNAIKSSQAADTVIMGDLVLGGDCAFHPIAYLQALNDLDAWYAFDALSLELPALSETPESASVDACAYAPVQSSGIPLADSLRSITDFVQTAGAKPVWVNNLSFSADILAAKAAVRGTLPEVVESDYMSRATAILLAYGRADKVFWRYAPLSGAPGAIALQSYANLSRTLGGMRESSGASIPGSDFEVASFRGSGRLAVLTWRKAGGDEALPAVIPGFEGYGLRAWSADTASMKNKYGVALNVDSGGSTALLVSERPVLISAKPTELKDSITLLASDSAAQAGKGLQGKFASFVQAQKAKAAEKVGAWVDEQQQSLMETLKVSFNQWLRKSLGLAKM